MVFYFEEVRTGHGIILLKSDHVRQRNKILQGNSLMHQQSSFNVHYYGWTCAPGFYKVKKELKGSETKSKIVCFM